MSSSLKCNHPQGAHPSHSDRDAGYGLARYSASCGDGYTRSPDRAPRSSWQNGQAEKLIGSIRRECLDHILVFGEAHLCQILAAYVRYYNELRTHLSCSKLR